MRKFLYTIKDEKTGYGSPFLDETDLTARRGFAFAVNNGSIMNFAPDDFSLWRIGEFDTVSCKIKLEEPKVFVCGASELAIPKEALNEKENH